MGPTPTKAKYFEKCEIIQDAVSADKYAPGEKVKDLVISMVFGLSPEQRVELFAFCKNVPDVPDGYPIRKKMLLPSAREISTGILVKSLVKSDLVRRGTVESGPSKKKLKTETTDDVFEEHFAVSNEDLKSMLDDIENKLAELETIRKGICGEADRRHNKARHIVAAAILKTYDTPKV